MTSNAFTFGGLSGSGNLAVKSPNLGYNAGAMGTYSLHQAEPNMGALEAYREAEGKRPWIRVNSGQNAARTPRTPLWDRRLPRPRLRRVNVSESRLRRLGARPPRQPRVLRTMTLV